MNQSMHVSLEIECVENLLFSKYDVDVYVDDSMQGTISHGTTETYNLNLTKGVYEIKFVSAEDDEVIGGVSIDIYQDESLKYKISCTSSQINVETIQGTDFHSTVKMRLLCPNLHPRTNTKTMWMCKRNFQKPDLPISLLKFCMILNSDGQKKAKWIAYLWMAIPSLSREIYSRKI